MVEGGGDMQSTWKQISSCGDVCKYYVNCEASYHSSNKLLEKTVDLESDADKNKSTLTQGRQRALSLEGEKIDKEHRVKKVQRGSYKSMAATASVGQISVPPRQVSELGGLGSRLNQEEESVLAALLSSRSISLIKDEPPCKEPSLHTMELLIKNLVSSHLPTGDIY